MDPTVEVCDSSSHMPPVHPLPTYPSMRNKVQKAVLHINYHLRIVTQLSSIARLTTLPSKVSPQRRTSRPCSQGFVKCMREEMLNPALLKQSNNFEWLGCSFFIERAHDFVIMFLILFIEVAI
jgi:hypothetical protein